MKSLFLASVPGKVPIICAAKPEKLIHWVARIALAHCAPFQRDESDGQGLGLAAEPAVPDYIGIDYLQ